MDFSRVIAFRNQVKGGKFGIVFQGYRKSWPKPTARLQFTIRSARVVVGTQGRARRHVALAFNDRGAKK